MPATTFSHAIDVTDADNLHARAMALVNPMSGIANDYLNLFNEILMLVENYPMMPELAEDIAAWKFVSYREYFAHSSLPGRTYALDAYDRLKPEVRRAFESVCADIAKLGATAIRALEPYANDRHTQDYVSQYCAETSAAMMDCLQRATYIVNHGVVFQEDNIQNRVDSLMARRANPGRRRADII